jgi:Type II secretion system (T2SS), protein E, N-terminal domain
MPFLTNRGSALSTVSDGMLPGRAEGIERRSCSSGECAGGWTVPWRNRRRPIFEGQWGCSGRCVRAIVRGALRREMGDSRPVMGEPHRHRIPLGLVMLAQGWITHPQLQKALELQRASGTGRIGDWLIQECGVGAEQVARGLSVQWSCSVLDTEGFTPERMALVMPRMFVEEFGVVPLRVRGERVLSLAFEDRLDASVALAVEKMTELQVQSGLVEGAKLRVARQRLSRCEAVAAQAEAVGDADGLTGRITALLEQKQPLDSRLVRLHRYYWLRLWLESGTKDRMGSLPTSTEDMQDYVFTIGI